MAERSQSLIDQAEMLPVLHQTADGNIVTTNKLSAQIHTPGNPTLMQWGPVQFQIHPVNISGVDHETETDWAHKEIAGAAVYREWVGENDEIMRFRGELFPYRIGGIAEMERLEALRRSGVACMLVRGDGRILGWFVCERLRRSHEHLSSEGIGQQISFEISLARCPVPEAQNQISQLWNVMTGEA